MLSEIYHSVFSPKTNFILKDFKVQKPSHSNFDISNNTIRKIKNYVDEAKSIGPNGLTPGFYVKTSKNLCNMLSVLRNIESL